MEVVIFLVFFTLLSILPFVSVLAGYVKGTLPKEKSRNVLLGFLVLSLVGFFLTGIFTIEPSKNSGNGNLGLLFIPTTVIVFIVFNVLVGSTTYEILRHRQICFILGFLIILSTLFILSVAGEKNFVQDLVEKLGGGPDSLNSKIYRFGWFNQYTNTMYFNVYTFIIALTVSCMMGILLTLYKRISER